MSKNNNRTLRCWVTGVEVRPEDAYVLNINEATRIRNECAYRLAFLDKLVGELVGRVGREARPSTSDQHHKGLRLVSPNVARAYTDASSQPGLFMRLHDFSRQLQQRVKTRWLSKAKFADRLAATNDHEWNRLYQVGRRLRDRLDTAQVATMGRLGMDAALALAYTGADFDGVTAWLAGSTPEALVAHLAPPKVDAERALALARALVEGAQAGFPARQTSPWIRLS